MFCDCFGGVVTVVHVCAVSTGLGSTRLCRGSGRFEFGVVVFETAGSCLSWLVDFLVSSWHLSIRGVRVSEVVVVVVVIAAYPGRLLWFWKDIITVEIHVCLMRGGGG